MKHLLFIFIISFSVFFSQENSKQIFTLKPALGINASQIHGTRYNGFNKIGIFAGAAVNAFINSKTSIELGFYFSQKGARHIPVPQKGDYNFYYANLNYIDLPLSLRHQLNKDYFITMGLSMAYLARYYEEINYVNFTGVYKFNTFDYGVHFGLGKIIKEKFYVEVRTSNSFLPIRGYGAATNNVFYPSAAAKFFNKGFYNNVLTLLVSYKINLKRKTSEQK